MNGLVTISNMGISWYAIQLLIIVGYIMIYIHTSITLHYITFAFAFAFTFTFTLHYIHTYILTYILTYFHTYIHTYTHTYIHKCIYIYTYMCVYAYTYIIIYICIYIYIPQTLNTPLIFHWVTMFPGKNAKPLTLNILMGWGNDISEWKQVCSVQGNF
jgi:hypothetical protein